MAYSSDTDSWLDAGYPPVGGPTGFYALGLQALPAPDDGPATLFDSDGNPVPIQPNEWGAVQAVGLDRFSSLARYIRASLATAPTSVAGRSPLSAAAAESFAPPPSLGFAPGTQPAAAIDPGDGVNTAQSGAPQPSPPSGEGPGASPAFDALPPLSTVPTPPQATPVPSVDGSALSQPESVASFDAYDWTRHGGASPQTHAVLDHADRQRLDHIAQRPSQPRQAQDPFTRAVLAAGAHPTPRIPPGRAPTPRLIPPHPAVSRAGPTGLFSMASLHDAWRAFGALMSRPTGAQWPIAQDLIIPTGQGPAFDYAAFDIANPDLAAKTRPMTVGDAVGAAGDALSVVPLIAPGAKGAGVVGELDSAAARGAALEAAAARGARLERAADATVDEGARLQPYRGSGGGHHVPAKNAFLGAEGYNPRTAPAVPNAELARLGVRHDFVTGVEGWTPLPHVRQYAMRSIS